MLHLVCLGLDKILQQIKRGENQKKIKKNREMTDVYGCTGIGGGMGYSVHG